jgi:hypothetical protein
MISRRGLITGLIALVAAPAIIRTPGLLMPIRPLILPDMTTLYVNRTSWIEEWQELAEAFMPVKYKFYIYERSPFYAHDEQPDLV